MTNAAKISFIKQPLVGDVVIAPRGRRMSWNATLTYNKAGRQEGAI